MTNGFCGRARPPQMVLGLASVADDCDRNAITITFLIIIVVCNGNRRHSPQLQRLLGAIDRCATVATPLGENHSQLGAKLLAGDQVNVKVAGEVRHADLLYDSSCGPVVEMSLPRRIDLDIVFRLV